jgi:hypothetical protein
MSDRASGFGSSEEQCAGAHAFQGEADFGYVNPAAEVDC